MKKLFKMFGTQSWKLCAIATAVIGFFFTACGDEASPGGLIPVTPIPAAYTGTVDMSGSEITGGGTIQLAFGKAGQPGARAVANDDNALKGTAAVNGITYEIIGYEEADSHKCLLSGKAGQYYIGIEGTLNDATGNLDNAVVTVFNEYALTGKENQQVKAMDIFPVTPAGAGTMAESYTPLSGDYLPSDFWDRWKNIEYWTGEDIYPEQRPDTDSIIESTMVYTPFLLYYENIKTDLRENPPKIWSDEPLAALLKYAKNEGTYYDTIFALPIFVAESLSDQQRYDIYEKFLEDKYDINPDTIEPASSEPPGENQYFMHDKQDTPGFMHGSSIPTDQNGEWPRYFKSQLNKVVDPETFYMRFLFSRNEDGSCEMKYVRNNINKIPGIDRAEFDTYQDALDADITDIWVTQILFRPTN